MPDEIDEYIFASEEEDVTPEEFVLKFEGTYNPSNGKFACTECYIDMGMPVDPMGWKPEES